MAAAACFINSLPGRYSAGLFGKGSASQQQYCTCTCSFSTPFQQSISSTEGFENMQGSALLAKLLYSMLLRSATSLQCSWLSRMIWCLYQVCVHNGQHICFSCDSCCWLHTVLDALCNGLLMMKHSCSLCFRQLL